MRKGILHIVIYEGVNESQNMDEKAILGFVVWLFICIGLVTVYTIPDKQGQACFGNVVGLLLLIGVLRLPHVRQRIAEPRFRSLLLVGGLLLVGVALSIGLGLLAQAF